MFRARDLEPAMSIEIIYLTGTVVAFTLLMVTLFIVKLWSDGAPAARPLAKPEITPARRPETDLVEATTAA